MLVGWLNRTMLEINVLHDRNPPFVRLSDGGMRNGYTVKILNKLHEPRIGDDHAGWHPGRQGDDRRHRGGDGAGRIGTDDLRELRVFVTRAAGARQESWQPPSVPVSLVVRDVGLETEMTRRTTSSRSARQASR